MERWQEINNYLNMSADWIQVILTGFGLWLASRYMKQHARKVRLEKSYELLHNCMLKIARHCADNHLFYKKVSAPKLKWILSEITAVEAVAEIKENFKTQFQQLNGSAISTFEIDAEIKLISNKRIQSLWEQLFENMASVGTHFEKINSVKEDEESCIDILYDTPFGLFGGVLPKWEGVLPKYPPPLHYLPVSPFYLPMSPFYRHVSPFC
jgi:hypothetical protein